jgi:hypothetical protein
MTKIESKIESIETESMETEHPLASAPQDVKLAVDLIYLLESNEIDPKVALSALKMVEADLKKKTLGK